MEPELNNASIGEKRARLAELLRARLRGSVAPQCWELIFADRRGAIPLSFAQERLWFLDRMTGGGRYYNLPLVMRLTGPLKQWAIEEALREITRRHEILRTTFRENVGRPLQVIGPVERVPVTAIDLTRFQGDREAELRHVIDEEVVRPFDLESGPVLRVILIRMADEDHAAVLALHHIVADWWSVGVLLRELAILFECASRGVPSVLPELPMQYADFAVSQRAWLHGDVLSAHVTYWRGRLAGALALQLPTDRPRPPILTHAGKTYSFFLPEELTDGIKRLSQAESTTLFMSMLAVFETLLYRYSGQEDFVVGSPVSNRNRAETEGLIGFFVNILPLRAELAGEPTFRELLRRVRKTCLEAYAHQELPFERLVEYLQTPRDLSRTPVFQVMLVSYDTPEPFAVSLVDIKLQPLEMDTATSKFDLTLYIREDRGRIKSTFEYNTDLFETGTIRRMAAYMETLIAAIVRDPNQPVDHLPLLTPTERDHILRRCKVDRPYPRDSCIHEQFEEQAALRPEAVALICDGRQIRYGELNRRANRLAHSLGGLGVGPETLVGTCLERSFDLIVAELAILKAGGSYLPLQCSDPCERLEFILRDAGAPLVLTCERFVSALPKGTRTLLLDLPVAFAVSNENPRAGATAGNTATVLYTSGSTGSPKGVALPHRGVVRLVKNNDFAHMGTDEVFLHHSNISFNSSLFEVWGALLNGATLVVLSADRPSLDQLRMLIREHGVTTLWLTAGLFHLMVDERLDDLRPLRQLLAGGDVLSPKHVERLVHSLPHCRFINGYGPTESTTFATSFTVSLHDAARRPVPIGRPIANTEVYVLDKHQEPVPIGVPGELHIAGDGLARGYLNRPGLTAERFIPHKFSSNPSARLYRTGDRCRHLPDGNIEFLGRLDNQVKIRGFRVEPEEIVAVLRQHPGVRDAAAVTVADAGGDAMLLAYVVLDPESAPRMDELRSFLRQKLPEYMAPSFIIDVPAIPLTPNGKVDRAALPPALGVRPQLQPEFVAPRTATERKIARIWKELLHLEVGINDNFFDLGGHSLLAIQMQSRLEGVLGRKIAIVDLFEHHTIKALARFVDDGEETAAEESAKALALREGTERLAKMRLRTHGAVLRRSDPISPKSQENPLPNG